MQVAGLQQLLLDARLDAFAEQRAVGQHQRGAAAVLQQVHDQHEEEVGGFAGAEGGGEVVLDAVFFHAAEGRVGDDDVDAVARAVVAQRAGEGVVVADVGRHVQPVQDHVGGAQQVRQRLLLDAVDALLEQLLVLDRLHLLLAHVFDGAGEEAAGAAGGVEDLSRPAAGSTISTMNWVTGRGV